MKMSDVKFNVRETESSENINPTMTFIGHKSIAAVHHMGQTYDNLVEALERIVKWNELSVKTRCDIGSNGVRDYYRAIAKEALKQAKGGG